MSEREREREGERERESNELGERRPAHQLIGGNLVY